MSTPSWLSRSLASVSLLALACSGEPLPSAAPAGNPAPAARAELLDAAHGTGNAHFFWLAPLVSPPAAFAGTFDGSQLPEIRICALVAAHCAQASDGAEVDVADFTTATGAGDGSTYIRVDEADQQYIVNWHTDRTPLQNGATYRLRALVAGTELGHADVAVGATGRDLRGVDAARFFPLVNGRTLPVAFRIEQGAVFVAPAGGGTLVTNGGAVTLAVPAGALPTSTGLTVFPDPAPPALPALVVGTAYDFGPEGTSFAQPLTVTIAYDPATVPVAAAQRLRMAQIVGGQLQLVPGSSVNTVAHTVSGPVSHFSTYGVGMAPPVGSVIVSPMSLSLAPGTHGALSVAVYDTSGNVLTDRTITSALSNGTVVSDTVLSNTSVDVLALAGGQDTLVVSCEGVSSAPVALEVGPQATTITYAQTGPDQYPPEVGATLQYTATARDGAGIPVPDAVTWGAIQNQPGTNAARVLAVSGNTITVHMDTVGWFMLNASDGSITAPSPMIMIGPQLIQQLNFSPNNLTLWVGNAGTVTVGATDIRGRAIPLSRVTWGITGASTPVPVAITGYQGADSSTVLVQAITAGSAMLQPTLYTRDSPWQSFQPGAGAFVQVNGSTGGGPGGGGQGMLVANIRITPQTTSLTLSVGQSVTLTATAIDAGGNPLPGAAIQWGTDYSMLSISPAMGTGTITSTITALTPGNVTLQAQAGAVLVNIPVTINP